MDKSEKLQKDILIDMETMDDSCRNIALKIIELAELQTEEMDRFWKAIGMYDKNISIDDAIFIVSEWKEKALKYDDKKSIKGIIKNED